MNFPETLSAAIDTTGAPTSGQTNSFSGGDKTSLAKLIFWWE
jgi:hypothetical protein